MALDRDGNTIEAGQVYGLAGTVRRIDGDTITIVIGAGGFEAAVRVAAGDVVPVGSTAGGPFMPVDASVPFTAAPSSNVAAVNPSDLARIAEVTSLFNQVIAALVAGLAGKAALVHTHTADDVSLSDSDWNGSLRGEGITTVQDLADWIDANVGGGA